MTTIEELLGGLAVGDSVTIYLDTGWEIPAVFIGEDTTYCDAHGAWTFAELRGTYTHQVMDTERGWITSICPNAELWFAELGGAPSTPYELDVIETVEDGWSGDEVPVEQSDYETPVGRGWE